MADFTVTITISGFENWNRFPDFVADIIKESAKEGETLMKERSAIGTLKYRSLGARWKGYTPGRLMNSISAKSFKPTSAVVSNAPRVVYADWADRMGIPNPRKSVDMFGDSRAPPHGGEFIRRTAEDVVKVIPDMAKHILEEAYS